MTDYSKFTPDIRQVLSDAAIAEFIAEDNAMFDRWFAAHRQVGKSVVLPTQYRQYQPPPPSVPPAPHTIELDDIEE